MAPPYSLTITNPGAETGDMTGWTYPSAIGSEILGAISAVASGTLGTTSHAGSYHFEAISGGAGDFINDDAQCGMYQDLDPVSDGASTTELDNGSLKMVLNWQQSNGAVDDIGTMGFQFLDGSGDPIEGLHAAPRIEITPEDTWTGRSTEFRVPSGTRTIRIWMFGWLKGGSQPNSNFDSITADLESNDLDDYGTHAFVDFRATTTTATPSGYNDSTGTTPSSIADLEDRNGNSTGWSFSTVSGSFNAVDDPPRGGWWTENLVTEASRAAATITTTSGAVTLRFGGLDTGKSYNIRAICSRFTASLSVLETAVTIGGVTKTQDSEYAFEAIEFLAESPDGSGNIDIEVDVAAGADFGYLNGLMIEEVTGSGSGPTSGTRRLVIVAQ